MILKGKTWNEPKTQGSFIYTNMYNINTLIHNIYKIYINVFDLGNQCGLFLTVLTFREVTVLSILGRC